MAVPIAPLGIFLFWRLGCSAFRNILGGFGGRPPPVLAQAGCFKWHLHREYRPMPPPDAPRRTRLSGTELIVACGCLRPLDDKLKNGQHPAGLELGTPSSPLPGANHSATASPTYHSDLSPFNLFLRHCRCLWCWKEERVRMLVYYERSRR